MRGYLPSCSRGSSPCKIHFARDNNYHFPARKCCRPGCSGKSDSADKGKAEIIIGKQRNGPIGTVNLTFLGQHTRFENYASAARF